MVREIWVEANVAGKITVLEAHTWHVLINLITDFVRAHPDQQISWGDLMWDNVPPIRSTHE